MAAIVYTIRRAQIVGPHAVSKAATNSMMLIPILLAIHTVANDVELVARMQRRDPHALAELYDRYGRLVYSLILRVVRDTGIAEDLVQETFLRVWNRVAGFDAQKGSIGPWLLAVARNRAIDYLRSSRRRPSVGGESEIETAVPSEINTRTPDFVLDDLILMLMANSGIHATSPAARVAASRRFAALAIQAFQAAPVDHSSFVKGVFHNDGYPAIASSITN